MKIKIPDNLKEMTLAQLIALSYWVELVQVAETKKLSNSQFNMLNKCYAYLFSISEATAQKLSLDTIKQATPILTKLFERVNLDIQKLSEHKEPVKLIKAYNETELERQVYESESSVKGFVQKVIGKSKRKKESYYLDKQELQPYQIWMRILDGTMAKIAKNEQDAVTIHYSWREIPNILACFAWRKGTGSIKDGKVNTEEINRKADVFEQINAELALKAYRFFLSTNHVSFQKPTLAQFLTKHLTQNLQAVNGVKNTVVNGAGEAT